MNTKCRSRIKLTLVIFISCTLSVEMARSQDQGQKAKQILNTTGVKGGLIIHIGCGDGKLTASLRASDKYLVQGLDTNTNNIQKAREYIQSLGIYGQVSVDGFDGRRLPYVDNLANLIVTEDLGALEKDEIMRVLCPNGTAYFRQNRKWTKKVKPRPEGIDEWTHYLYDASGNAVSHDMVVGPPKHFQWTGSPRWSRHHDRRSSISAMVSSGGRIFYIFDEGSTTSIMLPSKTALVARDAFNGTILWKRPIAKWFPHLWPLKSGPTQLQRRLVAFGDRVYVTLGLDAPLVALDVETGDTIRTYENTFATEEIILSDGVLFLLANKTPQGYDTFKPQEVGIGAERDRIMHEFPWDEMPRYILSVQADTGKVLWQEERPVVPVTLAVDNKRVYFHDGERVVALNRNTGDEAWSSEQVERRKTIPTNITPTLVVYRDVVLFYGATRKLTGVSAETGEILWTEPHPRSGHFCPEDVLVSGGLVWGGEIAGGKDSGEFLGRDPRTGEIKSQFRPDINIYFMHQRCYRSKATDRYLIPGWTGTEFIDFRTKHWETHHWVRSGCIYGVMPCNGLLYTTPHDCACYMQAKLHGFCALAPQKPRTKNAVQKTNDRLEHGPAYEKISDVRPQTTEREAWPTYRSDPARRGFTKASVSADLKAKWKVKLGGRLSSAVVADGKLFVASVDAHTVHALSADSGESLWSFTAGGRVDSPPTFWKGCVLFGCADGYVYCLRSSDGELVWRLRAAPEDRRMPSSEQIESVWPVSGSVLVQDGVVYCVAGRSMFLDGGLRYLRIDAVSGKLISEVIFDERDPETGKNLQTHVEVRNMPVALPDILSSDGNFLYMRSQQFNVEGNRGSLAQIKGTDADRGANQQGPATHLFSPTGFLDDTWWHRSYWVYGQRFSEGAGGWHQAGKFAPRRILVMDDSNIYGFGRKPMYYKWRTPLEYHLFATSKQPELIRELDGNKEKAKAGNKPKPKAKRRKGPRIKHPRYEWSRTVPLFVRAMALADKTLFIAGPPDVVDEEEAFRHIGDPEINAKLAEQNAALAGEQGSQLWVVSAENGDKLAEYKLESLPVFDSLIATEGHLYLATADGAVWCFTEVQQ